MTRKYTGTSDGAATYKQPGTEKLVNLFQRRYGNKVSNLGTWVVRDIRDKPGVLSTHATGRAADIGYTDRTVGIAIFRWLVDNSKTLGVEAVHDYVKSRAYRCTRGEGQAGVRTVTDLGPGGNWIHVELSPGMAQDATKLETAWRSLPRP
jgi:hypothetical protein